MFRQLLEQSRQLTNHIVAPGLTPIDRGLEQIEAQTRRLLKRTGARQDEAILHTGGAASSFTDETANAAAGSSDMALGAGAAAASAANTAANTNTTGAASGLSGKAHSGPLAGEGAYAGNSTGMTSSDPGYTVSIDSRTAFLLAKQGFDPERVSHTLSQIDLSHTFEPLQGLPDADIEAFLRNEHENIVSIAIEETKGQVALDFERRFELRLGRDWAAMKKRIFDQMGHHPSRSVGAADSASGMDGVMLLSGGNSVDSSSILQFPSIRHTGTMMPGGLVSTGGLSSQPRIYSYVIAVRALNHARLKNIPFNPIATFGKVAENLAGDAEQQLISRCWTLLSMMLGGRKGLDKKASGHFSNIYKLAQEPGVSEQVTLFRASLISGGRSWLQDVYRNWVSDNVRSQLSEIGRYAYCPFRIGGTVFWAHVFMLVRMGLFDDALEYIQRHQADLAKTNERNFSTYFKAWMDSGDGRLPKTYRDKLLAEWNGGIRDYATKSHPKGDLFKYALYKIIGRCEMTVKTIACSEIINTIDDYLWVQLMLVQEEILPTDAAYERYTLRDFSSRMQKYGMNHFKTRSTWFMVLFLCGEYERSVSELLKDPVFAPDGLHFAIALAYYGVLRVPDNPRGAPISGSMINVKPITLSTGSSYEIAYFHFAKTIISFVRAWGRTDPLDTMHYIYLIGLFGTTLDTRQPVQAAALQRSGSSGRMLAPTASNAGLEYTRLAHAIVCEYVLSSKLFSELLGQLRPDGSGRIPGHIEVHRVLLHLTSENDYIQNIVLAAAHDAESESRLEEAVYLYHLAGMPDKVMHLLNAYLGERLLQQTFFQADVSAESAASVSIRSTTDVSLPPLSIGTNPVQDTEQLLRFYQSRPLTASSLTSQTSFPMQADVVAVQSRVDAFLQLDESVARVMPQIMYMALQSLDRLYKAWTERRGGFGGSVPADGRVADVRERSRALMMFAGLVQYRIPSDIFGKMNRLDVMMS
ncbi:hypothetical protein BASA60_001162 [Batrachochytrium salamandrivorans]|nr:hypothetical protein BASA60_001162 [Batrachochytrium salamandrivorans]